MMTPPDQVLEFLDAEADRFLAESDIDTHRLLTAALVIIKTIYHPENPS